MTEESNEGVVLSTTIKRGTGTRDEDKHHIRVEREDLQEALDEFRKLRHEMARWAHDCRVIQPDQEIEVQVDQIDQEGELMNRHEFEMQLDGDGRANATEEGVKVHVDSRT